MAQNKRGAMKVDDLKVGQILIAVEHFGFSRTTHRETPYRVSKKMKTRLVVEHLREVEGALVPSGVELRFIVRDGAVSQKVEGRSERFGLDLHTEDDEMLPKYRAETIRNDLRSVAMRDAESAHNYLSKETAKRAIASLQKYLESIQDPA